MWLLIIHLLYAYQTTQSFLLTSTACSSFSLVSRDQWRAKDATSVSNLTGTPLRLVFIHHTDMSDCTTLDQCADELRIIQNFHLNQRGWSDIAYNFLVGEDGSVYEGRGWGRVGAHTHAYNNIAYGIAILGNFMYRAPNQRATTAVRDLIECGVDQGHIGADYRLFGHRDTGQGTLCPGDVLYSTIQQWPHFSHSSPNLH